MAKRGFFIAIEGIDGTGKTTLAKSVYDALQKENIQTVLSKEPTNGPYGTKLRESQKTGRLPLEEELKLFVDDRREHVNKLIKPALRSGKVVILDRYIYSTMAYQGARGASLKEIRMAHQDFLIEPDLLVILDLPVKTAIDRINKSRGETDSFENETYLRQVASNYLKIEAPVIMYADATKPTETLTKEILENFFNAEY